MGTKRRLIALLLAAVMLCLGVSAHAETIEKWGDGNTITLVDQPKYFLVNNMWGKGGVPDYSQSIFGDGPTVNNFGWRWKWPTGINNKVKSYPSIKVNSDSNPSRLPAGLGQGRNIWLEWDYDLTGFDNVRTPSGTFNCAWDIWINPSFGEKVWHDYEIMIWTYAAGGATPLGTRIASGVSLGGSQWDIYSGTVYSTVRDDAWTCISFKRTSNTCSIKLNLKDFMQYLLDTGRVSAGGWIHSIEAGSEIVEGEGRVNTRLYKCDVQQ
ncbi:GH12 family glycosyl hydrolase domain-containing protein [Butyrivibrio sp. MC2013]|uniref:GH12 family glycosyl hydrolase domain-containing protein n=1 Tax=Butyrivibrio sp. MC2013 TaxID=1280686 RepID=UPI000406837E|nr:hypothetical protein [Butyrivibrio sp. MC2013]